MESNNVFSQIISSLPKEDKTIVNSLHETALALGYIAKISPVGKKPDDWKCEYIRMGARKGWVPGAEVIRLLKEYTFCGKICNIHIL